MRMRLQKSSKVYYIHTRALHGHRDHGRPVAYKAYPSLQAAKIY